MLYIRTIVSGLTSLSICFLGAKHLHLLHKTRRHHLKSQRLEVPSPANTEWTFHAGLVSFDFGRQPLHMRFDINDVTSSQPEASNVLFGRGQMGCPTRSEPLC